jgi:hypothetical protein
VHKVACLVQLSELLRQVAARQQDLDLDGHQGRWDAEGIWKVGHRDAARRLDESGLRQPRDASLVARLACPDRDLTARWDAKDIVGRLAEPQVSEHREQQPRGAVLLESLDVRERRQGQPDALELQALSPLAPRQALPLPEHLLLRQETSHQAWQRSEDERPPEQLL